MKTTTIFIFVICFFVSCIAKDSIKNDSYKGVILKIFNDVENHNVFSFSIKTDKDKFIEIAEFFPYSWEYAEVGDSIIKEQGELSIKIIKKKGDSKIFYYQ